MNDLRTNTFSWRVERIVLMFGLSFKNDSTDANTDTLRYTQSQTQIKTKGCNNKLFCYVIRSTRPPSGPLARYLKLQVAHAPGIPGTFSPPPRVSDPDMYHGTCVTHVP